jgi:hypothetical protein
MRVHGHAVEGDREAGHGARLRDVDVSILGALAGYTRSVTFRDRLLATLRAIEPILDVRGVLVAGSEVPNLLEADAASTLVVSQDVDLAIPIAVHEDVKARLDQITRLVPSSDEPSVWIPRPEAAELIEVNFIGLDPSIVEPSDTYEKQDHRLPLMVFGPLSLLAEGSVVEVDGLRIPLPQPSGLALEKLVSDRTGEKGDRDLLVVAALLAGMTPTDFDKLDRAYLGLSIELRHQVRSNLSILSLLDARPGMPDPRPRRPLIDGLLRRLETP